MEELISVVVPIYNVEKYLQKCIDSILAQTYRHLEIILVDDARRITAVQYVITMHKKMAGFS